MSCLSPGATSLPRASCRTPPSNQRYTASYPTAHKDAYSTLPEQTVGEGGRGQQGLVNQQGMEAGREPLAGQGKQCMDSACSTAWEADEASDRLGSSPASCSGASAAGMGAAARPVDSNSAPVCISRDVGHRSHRWSAGSRYWLRTGLFLLLFGSMATCTLAHTAPSPHSSASSHAIAPPPASQVLLTF